VAATAGLALFLYPVIVARLGKYKARRRNSDYGRNVKLLLTTAPKRWVDIAATLSGSKNNHKPSPEFLKINHTTI
jgi:hypothetical protein